MQAIHDRELWARAVAGEPECFGLIFDRHAGAVQAYLRARAFGVGSAATEGAESVADLVSVVFLEAWRRRKEVQLESDSALPWLLGVARRVMLRQARTVRRHRAAVARLPAGTQLRPTVFEDPADQIAQRLDDTHRIAAVRAAFHHLPERDREVLLLCVWGGLGYEAAAVALGVPAGTVRSRLSRARSRLGQLIGQPGPGATAGPHHPLTSAQEKS